MPNHKFDDPVYDQQRIQLAESQEQALTEGEVLCEKHNSESSCETEQIRRLVWAFVFHIYMYVSHITRKQWVICNQVQLRLALSATEASQILEILDLERIDGEHKGADQTS